MNCKNCGHEILEDYPYHVYEYETDCTNAEPKEVK